MKKVFVLMIALMVISAPAFANLVVNGDFSDGEAGWTRWQSGWGGPFTWDASGGQGVLATGNGSFGWWQAIATVPGTLYYVTADWAGSGSVNWCELLFFNDDGRSMVDQLDAPHAGSVISKVDDWGMNGGMPFGPAPIDNGAFWYPSGPGTNQILATGTVMYVGLKTGASGGSTTLTFDNVVVDVVPEPGSMLALGTGLAGLAGFVARRRR